jgi:hypothetical protein
MSYTQEAKDLYEAFQDAIWELGTHSVRTLSDSGNGSMAIRHGSDSQAER